MLVLHRPVIWLASVCFIDLKMHFEIQLRHSDFLCVLEGIISAFGAVVVVEELLEVEWLSASTIVFLLDCAYVGDVFALIEFLRQTMNEQIPIIKLAKRIISTSPLTFFDSYDSDPFRWSQALSLQIKSHLISHAIIFVLI